MYSDIHYIAFSIISSKVNNYPVFNHKNLSRLFFLSLKNNINLFMLSEKQLREFLYTHKEKIFSKRQKDVEKLIERFILIFEDKNLLKQAESEKKLCFEEEIQYVVYENATYPKKLHALRKLDHPVYVLFYKGYWKDFDKLKIAAIIGSRNTSSEGLVLAKSLGKELSMNKIYNISGLALGADAAGHEGSMGFTGAVLGQGLSKIEKRLYPKENIKLLFDILNKGIVLSEIPPSKKPIKYYFLCRDRIISALADSVIVIESRKKGGTMKTFQYAASLNKKIIVWKKNIDGNLFLLKKYNAHSFKQYFEVPKIINSPINGAMLF
ncbi:DNA processing protein DprA [Thermosipho melanesiensis]|uniref:DNA processing protein DprA n=1 Tax=Thermosipho melanesiensis TaxID=46541 RepID=A0ABN4UTD3_9BACT|nr:DNA processing protein DprA [Thermosipho melanesiensis]